MAAPGQAAMPIATISMAPRGEGGSCGHQKVMPGWCRATCAAISRALIEAAKTPSRQQIDTLEAVLLQLPQIDIPVQHRFAEEEGLYAREIVITKGALMTGRVHKHQHVSIMISGDYHFHRLDIIRTSCNATARSPSDSFERD